MADNDLRIQFELESYPNEIVSGPVDGHSLDYGLKKMNISQRGATLLSLISLHSNKQPSVVLEEMINHEVYRQIEYDPDGELAKSLIQYAENFKGPR